MLKYRVAISYRCVVYYSTSARRVRFCRQVTIHYLDDKDEDRRSPWMRLAVDRHRFSQRIRCLSSVLKTILSKQHRLKTMLRFIMTDNNNEWFIVHVFVVCNNRRLYSSFNCVYYTLVRLQTNACTKTSLSPVSLVKLCTILRISIPLLRRKQ